MQGPSSQPTASARPRSEACPVALVEAAQAADPQAQQRLFAAYQDRVLAYCMVATRWDRDRSLDLCQETFIRAFRGLAKLREPARFEGWLFAIASNVCRDWLGRQNRRRELLQQLVMFADGWQESPTDAFIRKERIGLVRGLLGRIEDDKLRAIVELRYMEPEHTTQEISDRLGIPLGTVTVKLVRFRTAIRQELIGLLTAQSPQTRRAQDGM